MLTAQTYHPHGHGAPADRLILSYEDRFLRRRLLRLVSGEKLLVDLPQTTSLDHGGVLVTTEAQEIAVEAAAEPLYAVTGDIPRLAWHIGNRHTPCQVAPERLLIQRDPVIGHMLKHLGATLAEVCEPFTPEGGAYGHGRTHAHEHGSTAHAH